MFRCSGQIRLRLLQLLFEVKYTACLLDFDKVYRKALYFSIALKSMKIKHVLEILDFVSNVDLQATLKGTRKVELIRLNRTLRRKAGCGDIQLRIDSTVLKSNEKTFNQN